MEKNQYIVALEIGSSKIVGAIAEKTSAGYLSVRHLQEEKHLNSVRYGIVQNVENIKNSINRILRNLEGMIDGRITQVYMGVSGRSLHSIVSEVNRSVGSTEPITKELIDRIIHDATSTPIRNHDTVDIVPRAFYVDKVETPNPVGQFGSSIKIKVNLIVAKPALKLNLNRLMTFGIPAKDYIVTPLAVGEQILSDSDRELGCMLVDMGAETTTVTIYKNKALIYLSTLPLGGRNLTRDVMTLNVLEETAENIKKNINNPLDPSNVSDVTIEGVSARDAANYISARTGEIIANINQQLADAGVSSDGIQSIVLIGGSAHLGGLQYKLEETIKIKVRLGQNPPTLNVLNPEINRMEYIEVFSLLAKAAEMIESGETCVELNKYENGPTFEGTAASRQHTEPERPAEREPRPKKPEKRNRWKKWTDKLSSLMSEDDVNDEEQ